MKERRFLALDWGTTNLRAWVVDDGGTVLDKKDFNFGVGSLAPGEAERRFRDDVVPVMRAQSLPSILCGMIGSNLGWTAVPYLNCPATFVEMSQALHRVAGDGAPVWIVPGLRALRPDGGPDVMRGEETQLFGWLLADRTRAKGRHIICHPGTHAKWALMDGGRIETFVTSMTGELYAMLSAHSSLRVADTKDDPSAFLLGLEMAGNGAALASRLFTVRSKLVTGQMPEREMGSYLSGLLIGAEIASTPQLLGICPGALVEVIGDVNLCARYSQALRFHGYQVVTHDGEIAAVQGLAALIGEVMKQC